MTEQNRAASYVMITGASSGIGACFAERFAREGFSLVLIARREERLVALKEKLRKEIGKEQEILLLTADLNLSTEVNQIFHQVREKNLLIFINNAGFGDCGCFLDTDEQKELSMIDVNVKAMHLAMKLALQQMQKKKRGYILNVASSAGLLPAGPYMATYYATKAYVTSITRAVAAELAQQGSNIYLGALCPGPVDTEFNDVANVSFALKGISAEKCVDYAIKKMKKRKTIIVPSIAIQIVTTFGRVLPVRFMVWLTSRQQKKKLSVAEK